MKIVSKIIQELTKADDGVKAAEHVGQAAKKVFEGALRIGASVVGGTSGADVAKELFEDSRVNELEKCVILLQMFTFVGNDLYDENIKHYPGNCERSKSENFLIENASFIEY